MKRGHQYPHTRAPWSLGSRRPSAWGPPGHVSSSNSFQFIEDPADPGTVTSVDNEFEFARWSYQQSNAAIVWFVDWIGDNPLFSGSFVWKQIPDPTGTFCTARLTIIFIYAGSIPYATTFSINSVGDGTWQSPFFGFGQQFAHFGFHDARLIFYNVAALDAMGYQDLENLGVNSHDTSPVTWNY
jgi:hypothetical protein